MTMDNGRIRLGGWAELAIALRAVAKPIASSKKDAVKSQPKTKVLYCQVNFWQQDLIK